MLDTFSAVSLSNVPQATTALIILLDRQYSARSCSFGTEVPGAIWQLLNMFLVNRLESLIAHHNLSAPMAETYSS